MKKLLLLLIFTILGLAHPALPVISSIVFTKKGVEVNATLVQKVAKSYGIDATVRKDKNITNLIFRQNPKIEVKTIKKVLEEAYKNGAFNNLSQNDLEEIQEHIAPAKSIFFLPKGCKLDARGVFQVNYEGTLKKIKSNHWYAIPNNDRVIIIKECPKIKVYR